jgi:competence protein ComEC
MERVSTSDFSWISSVIKYFQSFADAVVAVTRNTADTPYCRPVIPLSLALAAGIMLGDRLHGCAATALVILLAAIARLVVLLKRDRSARWAPLWALLAAGYLAMVPWASPAHGPGHVAHYVDSGYWRIQGTVIDSPSIRFDRMRLFVNVERLSRDAVSRPVHGRIRLTVMGQVRLEAGDRLSFAAKIRSFRNFRNPGGFDYRRYMAFQGIGGSAWVRAEKLKRDGHVPRSAIHRMIHGLRRRLSRLIDAAGGAGTADEKAVLKALVYGDRSGIDSGLRQRFNRAGVGHLLAISGLHVGIVASVVFGCLCWILSFFPPLLWRGWGRQWAAAISIVPVLAYGMLAGMSASTQRAEIMVTVFLAALILGRGQDLLNTLAVAALLILALCPPALFSISFQLSFAAVLAIVYGFEKIAAVRHDADSTAAGAGRRLIRFVMVSALAIAGTLPVVLLHFNQTSTVGIAANLLLIPLVGFAAVPAGLLSALAALVSPTASALGFGLTIKILHLALSGVDFFAGLPFAAIKTVTPSVPEIVLYYLTVWALLNLRATTLAAWVLTTALTLGAVDGLYWSYQRFWHRDLKVMAIDVGQGASTLLELPGGKVILADGGGFSDNRLFDMGRLVLAPVLWHKKIATVDIMILSHPNADHLNGLIYIARHFNVRELWTNGDINTTLGFRELMAACREKAIVVRPMNAAAGVTVIGEVALTILNPPAEIPTGTDRDQEFHNNDSLVVKAAFGKTAFLIPGDIMARGERAMVRRAAKALASTVLFAPHHGSRTSSLPALIGAVSPKVVVISAGAGNRFGFPHAEVTDRYRQAGCRILCTATRGAISVRSDGKTVQVRSVVDEHD